MPAARPLVHGLHNLRCLLLGEELVQWLTILCHSFNSGSGSLTVRQLAEHFVVEVSILSFHQFHHSIELAHRLVSQQT